MSAIERTILPKIGALFFSGDDGEPMFQYTSDASSVVGPRKATDRDKETHAEAWAKFSEGQPDAPKPEPKAPAAKPRNKGGRPRKKAA